MTEDEIRSGPVICCPQRQYIEKLLWENYNGCNAEAIKAHLLQCPDCTEYVQTVVLPKIAEEEAKRPSWLRSVLTRFAIGAGAIATVGLISAVNGVAFRGTQQDRRDFR